jgi:hypothetical protein
MFSKLLIRYIPVAARYGNEYVVLHSNKEKYYICPSGERVLGNVSDPYRNLKIKYWSDIRRSSLEQDVLMTLNKFWEYNSLA